MTDYLIPIVVDGGGQADANGEIIRRWRRIDDFLSAWIVSIQHPKTRRTYAEGVKQWLAFCDLRGFDPLEAARPHVELWLLALTESGRKPRTIVNRLTALRSFYSYLVDEDLLAKDPTRRVPRPKIPRVAEVKILTESQMYDLVWACKAFGPHEFALTSLLCFNGLRINEACTLNIGDIGRRQHFPIINVKRKGGSEQWVEIGLGTLEAVQAAIAARTDGNGRSILSRSGHEGEPLLLTRYGTRMTQQAAQRILDRAAPFIRGNPPHIHPHMLRKSWCTGSIRQGVTMDQIVWDGGWVDARMPTSIYSGAHQLPGRGAAHRLEAAVYGG